jgi:hypothetical protein
LLPWRAYGVAHFLEQVVDLLELLFVSNAVECGLFFYASEHERIAHFSVNFFGKKKRGFEL